MNNRLRLILSLVFLPAVLFAQVRFSATTERTRIAMGEQVPVIATLITAKQLPANVGIPPVAPNDAFTLLKSQRQQSSSSSIQIINGKASQKNEITTTFYYFIAPKKTGSFVFPALSLTLDGTDYTTSPLTFSVTDAPVSNPDLRAFLTLGKKSLYAGEQTLLIFKIAQRQQAQGSTDIGNGFNAALGRIEESFGKNFSLTRLFTNQVTRTTERIDGEIYNVFALKFLLFPLATGTFTIPAIPYEYQELRRSRRRSNDPFDDFFGGGFFGGGVQSVPKTVFTAPVKIETRQLPPAPAGFNGAVGQFSLSAAADPLEVPAGEAVTLKVLLKGTTRPGSMGDITIPSRDDYELFTPEKQVSTDTGASGISTRKTYKYLLIPKNEGTLTIDPVTFTYFNPKSGEYTTASSSPITIIVTKGKGGKKEQTRYLTQEDIREVGRDIRYIKTNVDLKHQSRYPYRNPVFFLLFPLPLIMILLSLLYRFQSIHRDRNVAVSIRNKALAAALKQTARLKKEMSSLSPADFLGRLAVTIESYISRKFGFPATGRTLDELKEELLSRTTEEKTVADLTGFIEQLDGYRFGGVALDNVSREAILDKATTFLTGLEKGTKKEKKSMKQLSVLLLALVLAPVLYGAPVEHWFEQGNRAYADGEFDSAGALYAKIIESGTENAAVFYNYGNALFRLKKLGPARLAYEKALRLDPDDQEITANIRFLQTSIVDRVPEPERGFFDTIVWRLHVFLPLKVQLWIAFVLLTMLALAVSLSFFASHNIRLWLIYLSVLLGLLFTVLGGSIGTKIYESERISYAIVLEPSVDARNEPKGATILFTAHEGTKFRIRKTVNDWALVSLPNGVSGWVERKALGEI
ncbi:MAG: BatD family protein [Chitinispirillaceae bacterium]|nr:BatD family protein [Chitinispirillaceae bacterium]